MHIQAIIGRVAAGCVAALAFYMAFFMYEDEQGRWQSRIENLWISIYDRAKTTNSTTIALLNKLSAVLTAMLDLLFGRKLFSIRSVVTSISLALLASSLLAIPMLIYGNDIGVKGAATVLTVDVILFCSIYVSIRLRGTIRNIVPPVILMSILAVTSYYFSGSSYNDTREIGEFFAISLSISFLSDVIALAVLRKIFSTISTSASFLRIGIKLLLLLVVSLASIVVPIVMLNIIASTQSGNEVYSNIAGLFTMTSVCLMFLNATTAVYCAIPAILLLVVLIHKVIWPGLSRIIYPLCRFRVVTNMYVLCAIGTLFVTLAVTPSLVDLGQVLKIFH